MRPVTRRRRRQIYVTVTEPVKGMSVGGELALEESKTCSDPVVPANAPVPPVTVRVNVKFTSLGGLLSDSEPETVPMSVPALVVERVKLPVKGAGVYSPMQPVI